MSEKRFIVETVEITDCKTGKSRTAKVITDTHELCSCEDLYELCDDLNKLAEENEQLKEERNYFERKKCEYFNKYNKKHLDNIQLKEENEQLKSTIKEVTELLSDEVDLFSDKATEHDINAYVELKELDNKDAYYMATATKKAIRILKELQE